MNNKDLGLAYILGIICPPIALHRHYLGKHGTAVLQTLLWAFSMSTFNMAGIWFSGGLGLLWFIIDMFLLPSMVRNKNKQLAFSGRNRNILFDGRDVYIGSSTNNNNEEKKESPERQILRTAEKHYGRLTVTQVAMDTDLSLEKAEEELKKMVEKGYVSMDIMDKGYIVYVFNELEDSDYM
jgi:DNA-binding TFAR19-related protein (PDSD5 family)